MPRKIVHDPSIETDSEIKSPITKRAIIYGLIVGTLYVFLAIYTSLKTGVTFIAGSVLVGYILLSLRGKYNPQENVIITTIAEGSILVGVGVIASLPAIVIYSWTISQRKLDPVFYFVNSLFGNLSGNIWYDSLITPELLITIGLFAGVLGLFLVFPLKEQLLKLPWPGAVPVYRTIEGLGEVEEAKRTLLKGIGVGAAYTGIFTALGVASKQNIFQLPTVSVSPSWLAVLNPFKTLWLSTLPQWQQTLIQWLTSSPLPNFLGIANSPLIGAIGYFVGWKRALVIFGGAVWSIIVWIVWEGGSRLATYGTHFMLPMIYYTSMGVLVSYITWELVIKNLLKYREDQKKMKEIREQIIKAAAEGKIDAKQAAPYLEVEKMGRLAKVKQSTTLATARFKETIQVDRRKLLPMIISVAFFAVGTMLIFNTNNPLSQNILGIKVLDVPWYLILATTPLLPFSGWWLTVVLGEAGIAANYLTDSIVVPAILLFSVNLPSIVIFTTILGTWQQSAARLIARVRVGRELKVKDKIITKSMLIGIVPGAFISAFIIMLLYSYGGFGTAQFPAPAAAVTGLFFMSMVELRTLWLGGTGAGLPTTPTDPTATWFQFLYEQSKPFYLQSWFIGGDQGAGAIPIGAAVFFIAGFAVGLALAKYDWSPISLAVGLIIPPYIATTMFLGGILNYYVYRINKANKEQYQKEEMKYQNALAGVATGDGAAQILWILSTMFLL